MQILPLVWLFILVTVDGTSLVAQAPALLFGQRLWRLPIKWLVILLVLSMRHSTNWLHPALTHKTSTISQLVTIALVIARYRFKVIQLCQVGILLLDLVLPSWISYCQT